MYIEDLRKKYKELLIEEIQNDYFRAISHLVHLIQSFPEPKTEEEKKVLIEVIREANKGYLNLTRKLMGIKGMYEMLNGKKGQNVLDVLYAVKKENSKKISEQTVILGADESYIEAVANAFLCNY